MGHGMMGGSRKATQVVDPLFAKGMVLMDSTDATAFPPVVYVVLDWCEIRNDALAGTIQLVVSSACAQRILSMCKARGARILES
jgi:hypothetical protein